MRILLGFAAVDFFLHIAVANNYGYFRDELYYIVSGQHLQLGYVDFPPVIAYIAAVLGVVANDSLFSIHFVTALAGSALIVVAGLIARELGGNRWAQMLSAAGAFVTAQLGASSLFTPDIFDTLWWSLGAYLLVRIIRRDEQRLWVAFGIVAGLGLLTKLTIAFFLLSLLVGVLSTSARGQLRSKWFWMGAVVALLFTLPYVVWNVGNGWPTVDFYIHHGGLSGGGPLGFIVFQVLIANPVNLPLVFAGFYFFLRGREGSPYRLFGVAFAFLFVLYVVTNAKPYFFEAADPTIIAGGAILFSQKQGKVRYWLPRGTLVVLAIGGALLAPIEMPLLPPSVFVGTYSSLTSAANGATAQGNAGQFPQYLGDRFGWDTMLGTVTQVYGSLPDQEKIAACIDASNYGEASALVLLGRSSGLPPVISTHNNYYIWGPGKCGSVLIMVGDYVNLRRFYSNVTQAATSTCAYCMGSEDNLPVYVASNPMSSLQSVWPSIKSFG